MEGMTLVAVVLPNRRSTRSACFWMASMENREDAWKRYLAFVDIAGTKTFEEAAQAVGMKLPYAPGCIKEIGEAISKWIDANPI